MSYFHFGRTVYLKYASNNERFCMRHTGLYRPFRLNSMTNTNQIVNSGQKKQKCVISSIRGCVYLYRSTLLYRHFIFISSNTSTAIHSSREAKFLFLFIGTILSRKCSNSCFSNGHKIDLMHKFGLLFNSKQISDHSSLHSKYLLFVLDIVRKSKKWP